MIAAAVVAFRHSQELAAHPRQPRGARQFAQLSGHLPAMIAIGNHCPYFAHDHAHPGNERGADGDNNCVITVPVRIVNMRIVTHTG